ncbi:addiction module protein [Anatilimnocola floriformis]|uniref:addiction module protein n=1 Tax=Anatilimnocola floriformis TaxID=2948575 RepID=UPI0020C4F116|nr:addiction module protein [Anatilimnocola floriformis]
MVDFKAVLDAARQLTEEEQLRLSDMLRDSVPNQVEPLHEEWDAEIERRVSAVNDETAVLTSWDVIRDRALKRIGPVDDR